MLNELFNEYHHGRVKMVFENVCVIVLDENSLSIGRVKRLSASAQSGVPFHVGQCYMSIDK